MPFEMGGVDLLKFLLWYIFKNFTKIQGDPLKQGYFLKRHQFYAMLKNHPLLFHKVH